MTTQPLIALADVYVKYSQVPYDRCEIVNLARAGRVPRPVYARAAAVLRGSGNRRVDS